MAEYENDMLSDREERILKFIETQIKQAGYAPSVRDICAECEISSTSTVHRYLRCLEQKGFIKKDGRKSRAMSLESTELKSDPHMLRVPLLGKVTAGQPITAVQNFDGYVDFPASMKPGLSTLFALRVYGESMREAGIMDGDIVVVESRQYADDGDIVVAMLEDEATVKRFFKEKNRIRLQPENSAMDPIYSRDVTVLGKVIANFRFY